jgi:hypothetical protein
MLIILSVPKSAPFVKSTYKANKAQHFDVQNMDKRSLAMENQL